MTAAAARDAALSRAVEYAPFLAMSAKQRPALIEAWLDGGSTAAQPLITALGQGGGLPALLRRRRADTALLLALADLAGEQDFAATTGALTAFADEACEAALRQAFAERAPGEEVRGFAVLALGKQGSGELNYSSDIDPILIFDPAVLPRRSRDDPVDAAVRIARRWVELLSARTGDGYVLRVDLRLRPSPEATPIALPIDAAISYYESQALAWEQAAFIRARCCAGDRELGARFLDAIQPFIWRRSLDFGQLGRIADISRRVRGHYAKGQAFGPGYDLKRGRGGIREVEFFAQVQQLIHGGRDAGLRQPATLNALAGLARAGHIAPDTAERQGSSYVLLRTIEHRLQMVHDQQTHSLPLPPGALDAVARLHGLGDGAALLALLRPAIEGVGAAFDGLIGGGDRAAPRLFDTGGLSDAIAVAGFVDPVDAMRRIEAWRGGGLRVLRSAAAREALDDLMPALIAAIGAAADPDATLARFDALLGGLPSAINFFRLLEARPQLMRVLITILAQAPALATDLTSRPELIEGLIDASVFTAPAAPEVLADRLDRGARTLEQQLDHVRRTVGEHRFALGVQLIEGSCDPLLVSRGYADIADAALCSLAEATIGEFEGAHGRVPGGELLVLALGRQGGRALTHASDLDLVFLFTGDLHAESDGERSLGATTYFNRLGQRVIAALSVPTAAGKLYEVDVRLRPQGNQGPLVASLDAFARYQSKDAWTWEHMALTRARPVLGSGAGRAQLRGVIDAVLRQARDAAAVRADVAAMRADIAKHKPPAHPLDVKLVEGGLVTCEFAIHATQLVHRTGFDPRLNVALRQLIAAELAPAAIAPAMDLMGRMLVALRLMAPAAPPDDPDVQARIAGICGCGGAGGDGDWAALISAYDDARQGVAGWWASVSGGAVDDR